MIKANTLKVGDTIAYQSEFITENFIDNTGNMVFRRARSVYKVKEITPSGVSVVLFDKWLKSKWRRTRGFFSFEDIGIRAKKGIPFLKIDNFLSDNETETEIE